MSRQLRTQLAVPEGQMRVDLDDQLRREARPVLPWGGPGCPPQRPWACTARCPTAACAGRRSGPPTARPPARAVHGCGLLCRMACGWDTAERPLPAWLHAGAQARRSMSQLSRHDSWRSATQTQCAKKLPKQWLTPTVGTLAASAGALSGRLSRGGTNCCVLCAGTNGCAKGLSPLGIAACTLIKSAVCAGTTQARSFPSPPCHCQKHRVLRCPCCKSSCYQDAHMPPPIVMAPASLRRLRATPPVCFHAF